MPQRFFGLLLFLTLAGAPPLPAADAGALAPAERKLADTVTAIVHADYRGDRAELEKLAKALAVVNSTKTRAYREYWVGFAYWRRAINGFNENPRPDDLFSDLDQCAIHERSALAIDDKLEDARSALAGCLTGQYYLASQLTPEKKQEILQEGIGVMKTLRERAEGNPRSLWIVAGSLAFAPAPYGGHFDRAEAAYLRGLAAARTESLATEKRDPWIPVWGAPETLMSLAYMNTVGDAPNREAARAYAEGALSMAPDWHYVKDILIPKIEKMPEPPKAAATTPSDAPAGK